MTPVPRPVVASFCQAHNGEFYPEDVFRGTCRSAVRRCLQVGNGGGRQTEPALLSRRLCETAYLLEG